jgi:hypothetical protein
MFWYSRRMDKQTDRDINALWSSLTTFLPVNTLLLYIPLLALTDPLTDRQTEEQINPGWAG